MSSIRSTYNGFHVTPNYYSQGYADGSLFRAIAGSTPSGSIPNVSNYWSQVMQTQQNLYSGWGSFGGLSGGLNPASSYGQSGAYMWNGAGNAFGYYGGGSYGNYGSYGGAFGNAGQGYTGYDWSSFAQQYNSFSQGAFPGLQGSAWGNTDYSSAFGNFSLGKMNTYAGITAALSFLF